MSGAFGQTTKEQDIDKIFLSSPGEELVAKLLLQMSTIQNATGAAFTQLFGPYKQGNQQQRWADYARYDWSVRQLPAINVYEAEVEDKSSSNAWLNGTLNIMVVWQPNQRRSDLARIQAAFKGVLQNFFESQSVIDMLDEIYFVQRPGKVNGLNELGKVMTWSPNIEGIVEDQLVPITLVGVKYRIDLRSWYRALEFQNRTKLEPYGESLSDLTEINGEYQGVIDDAGQDVIVTIPDEIAVNSP